MIGSEIDALIEKYKQANNKKEKEDIISQLDKTLSDSIDTLDEGMDKILLDNDQSISNAYENFLMIPPEVQAKIDAQNKLYRDLHNKVLLVETMFKEEQVIGVSLEGYKDFFAVHFAAQWLERYDNFERSMYNPQDVAPNGNFFRGTQYTSKISNILEGVLDSDHPSEYLTGSRIDEYSGYLLQDLKKVLQDNYGDNLEMNSYGLHSKRAKRDYEEVVKSIVKTVEYDFKIKIDREKEAPEDPLVKKTRQEKVSEVKRGLRADVNIAIDNAEYISDKAKNSKSSQNLSASFSNIKRNFGENSNDKILKKQKILVRNKEHKTQVSKTTTNKNKNTSRNKPKAPDVKA